jgi:hypothetical protein
MRSPTPAMQAKLIQQFGAEPFLVVGVNWAGTNVSYYSDKSILDDGGNVIVEGRILSVNNIESILSISGTKSSISIDVTLDDSDETFLHLLNNVDMHKRLAWLYLMFDGLGMSDKLELFEGYIISGVEWTDGDRVFKITIESLFNNYEAGFSPEEGDVVDLKEDLIGKPWPMAFGTVYKMPLSRITDIPVGVTTEPMGFRDYWLDWQQIQLGTYDSFYKAAIEDQTQIILGDIVSGDLI